MNAPINTIIIDPNPEDRRFLSQKLNQVKSEIHILDSLDVNSQTFSALEQTKPELLFWDMCQSDREHLSLVHQYQQSWSLTIVITQKENPRTDHVYPANVIGHLHKPVCEQALHFLLSRWEDRRKMERLNQQVQSLSLLLNSYLQAMITVPTLSGFSCIQVADIVFCESDNNYSHIHLKDGKKVLVSKTLKYLETKLSIYPFVRIHKQHIINLRYLKQYIKGEGGQVELMDGTWLNVGRRRKEALINACSLELS